MVLYDLYSSKNAGFPHDSYLPFVQKDMYIYSHHGNRVLQWNHEVLSPANLQSYVDAITGIGAPLPNCFGFIDRTVRAICRPGEHQQIVYNGHKRIHALRFQSIALPNGLIGNLYGPVGELQKSKIFIH